MEIVISYTSFITHLLDILGHIHQNALIKQTKTLPLKDSLLKHIHSVKPNNLQNNHTDDGYDTPGKKHNQKCFNFPCIYPNSHPNHNRKQQSKKERCIRIKSVVSNHSHLRSPFTSTPFSRIVLLEYLRKLSVRPQWLIPHLLYYTTINKYLLEKRLPLGQIIPLRFSHFHLFTSILTPSLYLRSNDFESFSPNPLHFLLETGLSSTLGGAA